LRHPLISLSLVLLLLSPAALSWLATAWQKHAVKEAVEAQLRMGMDASELVVLAFAKSEAGQLDWEDEREFEYEGQMYDVVKTESRNDSLFYTCYQDRAETELNHKLDRWITGWLQHNPQQQEQSERLNYFFRSLYCISAPAYISIDELASTPVFTYPNLRGTTGKAPPSPPPDPAGHHIISIF